MPTVKIYKNTNKKDTLNVLGIGEIPPGEQISIVTDYHTPIIMENYPGLVDVIEEEQKEEAKDE